MPDSVLTAGIAAGPLGRLPLGAQGKFGQGSQGAGYRALCGGPLTGAALGALGGRAPLLALIGVPLALVSVGFAQLMGVAVQMGDESSWPTPGTLIDHFGLAADRWRGEALGRNDITFYAGAGAVSHLVTTRITE